MISWNSLSMLRSGSEKPDFRLQTDASGSWAYAAYFSGRWFQLPWDHINLFLLNLGASLVPTPLPAPLLEIISIPGSDWTSAHFIKLFIYIINTV